jgi:hypothetical protein
MDAVVTVCTSVAHLAGTLGIPTFVVLPQHSAYWVWGHGAPLVPTPAPWYPSVETVRAAALGDYGVINAERVKR